jgi:predicted aconitase
MLSKAVNWRNCILNIGTRRNSQFSKIKKAVSGTTPECPPVPGAAGFSTEV